MKQVHITPKQASQVPTGQMQESPCRMGTEAAGRGALANHTLTLGLVVGPHLVIQKWLQRQTVAGDRSLQEGPFQHEIPDYTAFQEPNAPSLPCSHRAGEETPLGRSREPSGTQGGEPPAAQPERMRNWPNEWDACRTFEVCLMLHKLINSPIHQNLHKPHPAITAKELAQNESISWAKLAHCLEQRKPTSVVPAILHSHQLC